MRPLLVLVVVLALLSAGCLAGEPGDTIVPSAGDDGAGDGNGTSPPGDDNGTVGGAPPTNHPDPAPEQPDPQAPPGHVVVAVVDSGINPYHVDFRATGAAKPVDRIPGFPPATPLSLSLNLPYSEAVEADRGAWDAVEVGRLYTIPGSRIAGAITFGDLGTALAPSESLILDDVGHGTGVASSVVRHGPHVDIVMVQVGAGSLDEGIAWAAEQPWIDVVSVSWGTIGNVPTHYPSSSVVRAMEAAHASGKVVVVAAGNEPTPSTLGMSGPPVTISVGGSSPDGQGETWVASKAPDVVSDFSPVVASHTSSDGTREAFGTSFAAPIVSGTLAEAWYLARAGGHDVSAQDLRAAMNATATYWDTLDYGGNLNEVPVVAPWVQMGWGYVDGSLATLIFEAAAGITDAAPDPLAAAYMGSVHEARRLAWG